MFSPTMHGLNLQKIKCKTILTAFIEIVNESNRKPNKIWVNLGRESYNKMNKLLDNNDILMYSTLNVKRIIIKR